jgi:SAM-dependent methyltransferase
MSLSITSLSSTEKSRISEVLRKSGDVREVVVIPNPTLHQPGSGLIAYVVPEIDRDANRRAVRHAYTAVVDKAAAETFALEANHDDAVPSLVQGPAERVLELACGSSRARLRLAEDSERYVGMDLSLTALTELAAAARRANHPQVELALGEPADAELFEGDGFDLVACDSSVHRFPDADYLRHALTGALAATAPGGRVSFGGIRDLATARAMHASAVLSGALDDAPGEPLAEQWRRRMSDHSELLVDARWFTGFPGASRIDVRPRLHDPHDATAEFSLDVVAWSGDSPRAIEVPRWLEWSADTFRQATEVLTSGVDALGLRRVPRAGVAGAVEVARILANRTTTTAQELRLLAAEVDAAAVRPAQLASLARQHGYRCHFSRAAGWPDGELDVAFVRERDSTPLPRFPAEKLGTQPGTNNPIHHSLISTTSSQLIPKLREYAAKSLPAHLRPLSYLVVPELPRTTHGTVDSALLPRPDDATVFNLLDRTHTLTRS